MLHHPSEESAVVATFEDRLEAENAVDALHQAGFASHKIGYALRGEDVAAGGMITDAIGAKDGKGAAAGAVTGGLVGGVVAATLAAFLPGVGPIVAGGILASFFGGAVAGTAVGGILGALTGLGVSEHEAHFFDHQFRNGKAIVAVKAGSRAAEAADILVRFGGSNIHSEAHSSIRTEGVFHTP